MVKKYSTHSNKTKKRVRKLQKGIQKAQRLQNRHKEVKVNFPAIELLNDPQGFAEKLLADLKHSNERFEVRRSMATHGNKTLLVSISLAIHQGQNDDDEFYLAIDWLPQADAPQLLHLGAALPQAAATAHHSDHGHRCSVFPRRTFPLPAPILL